MRDPTSPLFEIPAIADGRMFPVDLGDYGLTPDLPTALDALVEQLHAPALPPPTDARGAGDLDRHRHGDGGRSGHRRA